MSQWTCIYILYTILVFEDMLCFCELCRTLTADQLPHAESRGRGGGGGGGRGLVERTLSVGHVEQVGLR